MKDQLYFDVPSYLKASFLYRKKTRPSSDTKMMIPRTIPVIVEADKDPFSVLVLTPVEEAISAFVMPKDFPRLVNNMKFQKYIQLSTMAHFTTSVFVLHKSVP